LEEKRVPGTKAELLLAIQREWNALQRVVSVLDERQLLEPDAEGWTPKDNLAHLAEWLNILMGFYIDRRRAHEVMDVEPEVTQAWDFEARNRLLFERNRDRPLDEVLQDLQRRYADLTQRLDGMSFDDLLRPQNPFDPLKRPLLEFVLRGTVEHFAEHRSRIEHGD
jgi:hypothetical protein